MKIAQKVLIVGLGLGLSLSGHPAKADADAGKGNLEMLFGSPDSRKKLKDHNDTGSVTREACDGYDGMLGIVNGFFCHMEKDMGIRGLGKSTKVFGTTTVRAEVTAGGSVLLGGVTTAYDYTANVWVCNSACGSLSSYVQAFHIVFSYKADGTVNKGFLIHRPGVFDNSGASNGMQIQYDIGSSTSIQTVSGKMIFANSGKTFKMRAVGEKTATTLKMNVNAHDGTNGFRYALSTGPQVALSVAKFFNLYAEGSTYSGMGVAALGAGAQAAIASSAGACFSATDSGSTHSFVAAGASNCSALNFLAFDFDNATVSAYSNSGAGANNVLRTDTLDWNGMPANPAAI